MPLEPLSQEPLGVTPGEAENLPHNAMAWLASHLCGTPVGVIVHSGANVHRVRSAHGITLAGKLPDSAAFAQAAARREPLIVLDTLKHPHYADDPWFRAFGQPRFVAALPLVNSATHGFVVVADHKRRPRWAPQQRKALEALAHQLAHCLGLEQQCERQNEAFDNGIRFVAEEVDELVAVLDRSGKRLYNNPAYRELFSRDPQLLRGTEPFDQIHPDDRERMRGLFRKTVESKQENRVKYRFVLADETVRDVESRGTPILDAAGEVAKLLIVSRDLTKRAKFKEEEDRIALQLQRRHSEMSSLNQMANLLHRCDSKDEMRVAFRQYERGLFPESSGAVYVFNPGLKQFEEFVAWGNSGASKDYFSKDECWAVRTGGLHVVAEFDRARSLVCKHLKETIPPYLCVNVSGQGDTNVLLHLQLPLTQSEFANASERNRWISAQQEVASAVARHLALAMDKLEQKDYLQRQAEEDRVTGLFNRSFMDDILRREVLRYARNHANERTLGIIILDIDHFKQVNTRYTHVAGDYVLGRVGKYLRTHIRDTDFACRYGGEEFLLIMPEASDEGLRERAENLRAGIGALKLEWGGQPIRVTLSAGVACLPENEMTAEDLKRGADGTAELANRKVAELKGAAAGALREAKEGGRNRVVVWGHSEGGPAVH